MKRIMKGFIYLCAFIVPGVHAGIIDDVMLHGTKIVPRGLTTLTAHSATLKVRVVFKTHTVDIGKPSDVIPKVKILPCTYSRYPCSPVDDIAIFVDGKAIDVPDGAYRDLADADAAKITLMNKNATLTIVGGDASMSYIATVQFDERHVTRTTWASGLAPDKVLRETIYHYLPKAYFNH